MRSVYVANLMTVVILADAFCTIVDIDYRASELVTPRIYPLLSVQRVLSPVHRRSNSYLHSAGGAAGFRALDVAA